MSELAKIEAFDKFVQLGGGLGDIYDVMYQTTLFEDLWRLPPQKKSFILMQSHNPSAETFFTHLPYPERFEVVNLGYHDTWEKGLTYFENVQTGRTPLKKDEYEGNFAPYLSRYTREFLEKALSIAYSQPIVLRSKSQLTLPVPENDVCFALSKSEPYIVLHASAGLPNRSIPKHLVHKIIRFFYEQKIGVIAVGKTYERQNRIEYQYGAWKNNPYFINLIDKLSVYDTVYLLRNAVGAVCCHSSVSMVSWHEKIPQLLLYDRETELRHFSKNIAQQYVNKNWNFGASFPYNMSMNFDNFERNSDFYLFAFVKKLCYYNEKVKEKLQSEQADET